MKKLTFAITLVAFTTFGLHAQNQPPAAPTGAQTAAARQATSASVERIRRA